MRSPNREKNQPSDPAEAKQGKKSSSAATQLRNSAAQQLSSSAAQQLSSYAPPL